MVSRVSYTYFLFYLIFSKLVFADPLLVAVLMVKNEELSMEMTLQPLIDEGIKDFLIYDTGSTDSTVQITRDFFAKNNILNYVIEEGDFVDFSTSRNRALQLTEQHFPKAVFMLMLDAEWILHSGGKLLEFCDQYRNDIFDVAVIDFRDLDIIFGHFRVIRCKKNIKFVGKVHEAPIFSSFLKIPSSVYFSWHPTNQSRQKTEERWKRDKQLLIEEFHDNPENVHALYHLARTCFLLQDMQSAMYWYEYYFQHFKNTAYDFNFYMDLAKVYGVFGDYVKMVSTYLKAYQTHPNRAESLVRLARYFYANKEFNLCYFFSKIAVSISYPSCEVGLVEKELYDFVRFDLLSATAYLFQDYQIGLQATKEALKVFPDKDYLHQNLLFYQNQLKIKG